jgi:hypothetical protein
MQFDCTKLEGGVQGELGTGCFFQPARTPWLAIGGKREGGLICQGDFIRKIALENIFGFQTQIDDLRLKGCILGGYSKNKSSGRKSQKPRSSLPPGSQQK